MKITHLIWAFPVGGAETMLVDIINEQVKENQVALIIINKIYNSSLLEKINPKVKIHKVDRSEGSKNPKAFIKLNFLLLLINPNIIHCHNVSLSNVLLPFFLKNSVITVHGFNRAISKNHKYKKVIAISNAIKCDLENKGVDGVEVIPNGVLTKSIKVKKTFNDQIQVVCIGRLNHEIKGQDLLIKAFSNLIHWNDKIKLNFIGDGPSFNYLKNLSQELNIEEKTTFHGLKTRDELYKMLKDFDIVVQPSIHEGFGLAAVEAMIAKVPLIISHAEGLKEVTNNCQFGTLPKGKSSKDYEICIKTLIKNIEGQKFLKKNQLEEARRFAIEKFSLNRTCRDYFEIYTQVIDL